MYCPPFEKVERTYSNGNRGKRLRLALAHIEILPRAVTRTRGP